MSDSAASDDVITVVRNVVFVLCIVASAHLLVSISGLYMVDVGEPQQSVPEDATVNRAVPASPDRNHDPSDRFQMRSGKTVHIVGNSNFTDGPDVYDAADGYDYVYVDGSYYSVETHTSTIVNPEIRHDHPYLLVLVPWAIITLLVSVIVSDLVTCVFPDDF